MFAYFKCFYWYYFQLCCADDPTSAQGLMLNGKVNIRSPLSSVFGLNQHRCTKAAYYDPYLYFLSGLDLQTVVIITAATQEVRRSSIKSNKSVSGGGRVRQELDFSFRRRRFRSSVKAKVSGELF